MKFIKILLACLLLVSCKNGIELQPTPIEKWSGKDFRVAKIETYDQYAGKMYVLLLKNKDSIFFIKVLEIDGKDLKIGDTIK